jgi:hypothetical protein
MAVKIVPFHQEHLDLWYTGSQTDDMLFVYYTLYSRDPDTIWTAFDGDLLLGFGGIEPYWTDAQGNHWAEAWIKIQQKFLITQKDRNDLAWKIAWKYKALKKKMKLKKLQVLCDKKDSCSCNLVQKLGFKKETELRCMPPKGNDAILFSIV